MRNAIIRIAAAAALSVGVALVAQAAAPATKAGKKLYCWDEGGHKVCGDTLPASAAGAARTEISAKSGRTLDTVGPALNAAERAAAELKARQEQQAAAEKLRAQRRELAMIDSYATEADLRRAYAERATLIDDSIKTSQLNIESLHITLSRLLAQAADNELSGRKVPQDRIAGMRSAHAELLNQQRLLDQQRDDRAALDTELADSVQRYRAVKSPSARTAPTPAAAAPAPAPTPETP